MRRKNRNWVGAGVAVYLLVIWSAYRWSVNQRIPEGTIFNRIEREGIQRLAAERAKEVAAQPKPTGESRLTAAGPAFVAARYDRNHVVFIVVPNTESRFSGFPRRVFSGTPTRISGPTQPAAPLAGLQELYEPDEQALHFLPKTVQETHVGEQWALNVSPDSNIAVTIEQPVIAPIGCSLGLGFLASVPADQVGAFGASSREYFAIRSKGVESVDPPVNSRIGEFSEWKVAPATAKRIELELNDRMKQELATMDARIVGNAGSRGASSEFPMGARMRAREWIRVDQGLARGEGKLDYDVRAFRLTPDGAARLFVRARWKLADAAVFLMSAWFRADPAQVVLLSSDVSWSSALREGDTGGSVGESLEFQTVLNEFDADHDGWAELLVHSDQGDSSAITLYLYTDLGLVPMKTPLRRDVRTPESCLDP